MNEDKRKEMVARVIEDVRFAEMEVGDYRFMISKDSWIVSGIVLEDYCTDTHTALRILDAEVDGEVLLMSILESGKVRREIERIIDLKDSQK